MKGNEEIEGRGGREEGDGERRRGEGATWNRKGDEGEEPKSMQDDQKSELF